MRLLTLQELHCPCCGSDLDVQKNINIHGDELIDGVVKCNCRRYPLVEGILVFKTFFPDEAYRALLDLDGERPNQAFFSLIRPRTFFERIVRAACRRGLPLSNIIASFREAQVDRWLSKITGGTSFSESLDNLKLKEYGCYFKHRFSSTSYAASLPLIFLMRDFQGPILEMCCGMGHHGFTITRLYHKKMLISCDISFINLYLAKRFFTPNAEHICLDTNYPLPFPDGYFGSVFLSDSLHYIDNKKLAVKEFTRVSTSDSIILLSHLHNLHAENIVAGNALDKDGWRSLSDAPCAKLLSEPKVFDDFVFGGKLDLLSNPSSEEMEKANAFALVASQRRAIFNVYDGITEPLLDMQARLIINPIYEISTQSDGILLRKKWPLHYIQDENKVIDKIIPDSLSLNKEILKEIQEDKVSVSNRAIAYDLMRKFVLINAPERY